MSDPGKRTNPLLIMLAVILCVAAGIFFVRPGTNSSGSKIETAATVPETESQSESETEKKEAEEEETPTKETPTPTPEDKTAAPGVSDAAASGTWTSSGSSWMFLVNGSPYTGWLTDTDGKTYYFNSEGIMQTGWVDDNGKRYYMDLDGIMQKARIITVDGASYELLNDGSVKGYESDTTPAAETETTETPSPEAAAEPTATPTPAETPEPTATPTPEAGVPEVTAAPENAEPMYVALTFDNSLSDNTSGILDVLEQNGAKATFFITGLNIGSHTDQLTRMESLGYELGNNSYDNLDLTTMDYQSIKDQYDGVNEELSTIVGHGATVATAPYGSINDDVLSAAYLPMILWSMDITDSNVTDSSQLVESVLSQVQDGAVIRMHGSSVTAEAVTKIVPALIKGGYQLVTVTELANQKGIALENGATYSNFTTASE